MPTALLFCPPGTDDAALTGDLRRAGIDVLGPASAAFLLHDVVEASPDMVVVHEPAPGPALFEATATLEETAPRPVIVFTPDADAERMERAVRSGIHAYIVDGYSPVRLRGLVQLAQARFRHEQLMRKELADVRERFAERKLVDRARGILMGTRRLREEEAYAALRTAAMHTKQRIGQVARQVIDGAALAEAVNRAGQLRMLSQRAVKLYALCAFGARPAESAALLADAAALVQANLRFLGRALPGAEFTVLLGRVQDAWRGLRHGLAMPADPGRIGAADMLAEDMLARAEELTSAVEVAGYKVALHVVNVAGRLRMVSQRYAKLLLLHADPAALAPLREWLEESMRFLEGLPMTNPPITAVLAEARAHWSILGAVPPGTDAADTVAVSSEALLGCFERLTDELERAVQVLAG